MLLKLLILLVMRIESFNGLNYFFFILKASKVTTSFKVRSCLHYQYIIVRPNDGRLHPKNTNTCTSKYRLLNILCFPLTIPMVKNYNYKKKNHITNLNIIKTLSRMPQKKWHILIYQVLFSNSCSRERRLHKYKALFQM